ncbi:MAG: GDP-mannose 4,6-dehydratase [Actinomycetota bacterium]|nr:GDP-mannose 4,6-dehydratase [Actinomycetota bacterium]
MKVLVTGGAGFIGSHLVDRLLALGNEVDVVDSLSTGSMANLGYARVPPANQCTFHRLDIRSPEVVELMIRRKPQAVYHLAAQPAVQVSVAQPVFDAEVNLIGSLRVFEGARAARVHKLVFASSGGAIYGDVPPLDLPVGETHAQHPLSPYGVAKKAAVDYLVTYRRLHGLEYTALAFANVYGPRQSPKGEAGVVAIFAAHLLAGQPCTIFGDGSQTRDFIHVADVVDALVRAATSGDGMLLNIGTGTETTVNDLYTIIAREAGTSLPPTRAPAHPGDIARSCLCPAQARQHLGWSPQITLSEGIATVVEWFRQHQVY